MRPEPHKRVINIAAKDSAAAIGSSNTMEYVSPQTGKKYILTLKQMAAEDVKNNLVKSIYNDRSDEHLKGSACVSDILPAIKKDGKNTVPGYVVGNNDGVNTVLSGLRRSHAVSLCEGAVFVYWYADSMDVIDQIALATNADKQEKPSAADRVLALQKRETAIGEALEDEVLAGEWGVTVRYVREIRRFMKDIPVATYNLFPALRYIPYRFLQRLLKYTHEEITNAVAELSPCNKNISDDTRANAESRALQNKLMLKLNENKAKKRTSLPKAWSLKYKEGVTVAALGKNKVKVTIELSKLTLEEQKSLTKLLELQ